MIFLTDIDFVCFKEIVHFLPSYTSLYETSNTEVDHYYQSLCQWNCILSIITDFLIYRS